MLFVEHAVGDPHADHLRVKARHAFGVGAGHHHVLQPRRQALRGRVAMHGSTEAQAITVGIAESNRVGFEEIQRRRLEGDAVMNQPLFQRRELFRLGNGVAGGQQRADGSGRVCGPARSKSSRRRIDAPSSAARSTQNAPAVPDAASRFADSADGPRVRQGCSSPSPNSSQVPIVRQQQDPSRAPENDNQSARYKFS